MAKKKKNTKAPRSTTAKKRPSTAAAGDTPVPQAIKDVKDEIVEHVRRLADGSQMSVYELVEKGKELLELERIHGEQTPTALDDEDDESSPLPAGVDGPITAEVDEDDF